jgi:hypothetical protein
MFAWGWQTWDLARRTEPPACVWKSVDMAGTHISKTARCGPLANLFFAIINLEMSVQGKKRDWFDLGAKAYSQACPVPRTTARIESWTR